MPRFLFQPDPTDGYEFYPISIDIHLGIIKIPTKEIIEDGAINNTEAIIVRTDRMEVLDRYKQYLFENLGDMENSKSQIFDHRLCD